jgi:hypothetical protein
MIKNRMKRFFGLPMAAMIIDELFHDRLIDFLNRYETTEQISRLSIRLAKC